MKTCLRALTALIAGILLLLLPATAQTVDPDDPGTLTLNCLYGNSPISGMRFSAYRVASVDAQGRYTLLPAYEESGVNPSLDGDAAYRRRLAGRLTEWVAVRALSADGEAVTDINGAAEFGALPAGLYLVAGTPHTINGYTYSAQPAVIGIPDRQQDGDWQYDVTGAPKLESTGAPPTITVPDQEPAAPTDKLPQTGLPRLPVTLLAVSGMLMVGLGLLLRRRREP